MLDDISAARAAGFEKGAVDIFALDGISDSDYHEAWVDWDNTNADIPETDEKTLALKNAIRVEHVKDIISVVEKILEMVPSKTLQKIYSIQEFSNAEEFLELVGRAQGKLKKDGIPDLEQVGKIVVRNWQRNKIPYFVPPPPILNSSEDQIKEIS